MHWWIQRLTDRELVWMASDTSVVQKMEEAQMTTWPGHCNTHFFLGTYQKNSSITQWRILHTS